MAARVEAVASRGHHGATAFSSKVVRAWHNGIQRQYCRRNFQVASESKMVVAKRNLNQKDIARLTHRATPHMRGRAGTCHANQGFQSR
jgi:hypothetical protein